ncbi:class I mannose-6-phosphate isomerase [Tepidanaerobacter acetatoxydans]|uniref:class I mannose-6-phosphate isomerase n=1 Tax=Tepidanaerobacter acetatoxydans TaxID=499229 RepID=UPI001BD25FB2|nr:class I mannose-6-phosphate isomerase [Tepidanaerobacter acetatoxydans]
MSFMFKPLAYDDPNAVNYPLLPDIIKSDLTFGTTNAAIKLVNKAIEFMSNNKRGCAMAIDGYASAKFNDLVGAICQNAHQNGFKVIIKKMEDLYLSTDEIDEVVKKSLPKNYEEDPVLLFGKLFDGTFADFLDSVKVDKFLKEISNLKEKTIYLLIGYGSGFTTFEDKMDFITYIDVTPKTAAIRARNGQLINIGDHSPRPFAELMRRNYYVDFEIILSSRKHLLKNNLIDFYICGDHDEDFILMSGETLTIIFESLVKYPFRCKPVYLEGIWGGEFVRKVRKLPMKYKNIAWVFDLIPMEVSIVVDVDGRQVEFPFFTFVQKCPEAIMGEKCTKDFDGYFPIRFNYDDTYHSNGNMSIQVHPDEDFCMDNYNEKGRQDEAYYVVATGHGAKTYVGFNEDIDPKEFIELAKKSEKDGSTIDYVKYINHIDSNPGRQIMIPAGTIHASGRNQLILELGSLTIGSYTYKMYDYNRRDVDGNLRPIHSLCGEKVLRTERTTKWVNDNIAIEPDLIRQGDGYKEYIVGKTDLMYYQTNRIELEKEKNIECNNNNQFTVLTLVDGEEVLVYSKSNPDFCYHQKFLDIVVVPATIKDYVVKNIGYQPVVIHKTMLKDGYKRFKNR